MKIHNHWKEKPFCHIIFFGVQLVDWVFGYGREPYLSGIEITMLNFGFIFSWRGLAERRAINQKPALHGAGAKEKNA